MLDWMRIDARVAELVARRRRGLEPEGDRWLSSETRASVREFDDPLAHALGVWLDVLALDVDSWDEQVEVHSRWQRPRQVVHHDEPTSAARLRAAIASSRDELEAEQHAEALVTVAESIGDAAFALFERRLELQRERGDSAPDASETSVIFAQTALERSHDLARAVAPVGKVEWLTLLRSAVGHEASEGWPARLTTRWLFDVVAPSGSLEGLRIPRFSLPEVWGASSFARALASLAMFAFDAARPPSIPFVLHQLPDGLRRLQRGALWASLIGDEAFARRVLSLGRERAREHRRQIARSQLAWLRLRAVATLLSHVARDGKQACREAWRELAETVMGRSTPRQLFAVLPALARSAQHAALPLLAAPLARRQQAWLVEQFDEDWFQNPRTGPALRDLDRGPDEVLASLREEGEAGVRASANGLVEELERALD